MSIEYSVHILWSVEDGAYIASVDELPGCLADGQSVDEALANLKTVAREWIEVATEEGREIPKPMTVQDLEKTAMEFQQGLQQNIQKGIETAVKRIMEQLAAVSAKQQAVYHFRPIGFTAEELEPAGGRRHR